MPDADLVLEGGGDTGLGTAGAVIGLLAPLLPTALVGRDQTHLERPGVRERTMTVDTSGTSITEFGIGQATARDFLQRWNGAHP